MTDTYAGLASVNDSASHFNVLDFIGRRSRNDMWTCTIVKVIAVDTSAKTVDIQPCVNQLDGSGKPWPHDTIHAAPYLYWQGGLNSVQIDPAVGDIGLAMFASHDVSGVIANKAPANPGSFRRFDPSDALYITALPGLNPAATQTIALTADGITITSTVSLTINSTTLGVFAATPVVQQEITGDLSAVTDTNAMDVLQSIIDAGVAYGLWTDGTT